MKNSSDDLMGILGPMVGLLLGVALLALLFVGIVLAGYHPGFLTPTRTISQTTLTQMDNDADSGSVPMEGMWQAPNWGTVEAEPNADLIRYGKELVANTSEYLGPRGKVRKMSNGMNCQNCHLNAGTVPFGNNYGAVASTYPKVRARSGQMEDIPKRINDCFERSLNGKSLERNSPEMLAMVAYMEWLGKDVPKGKIPHGTGIYELAFLDRPADPVRGKAVYALRCQSCHLEGGQGVMKPDMSGYVFPPLWGEQSYNVGAGLYRLSRFAGYVKANMPLGVSHERPDLTDEQAWDVAAYVNSLSRPALDISADWPDISKKPVDHPFGPYSDGFSEAVHKFGPFKPIREARQVARK